MSENLPWAAIEKQLEFVRCSIYKLKARKLVFSGLYPCTNYR
jgi:hypothetical protein